MSARRGCTAAGEGSPAPQPADRLLVCAAERCVSMKQLRRVHAMLVRHHHRLRNPSLVLAKLLRFAAVSPGGDLCYAARLLSHGLHCNEIHSGGSAFFYNTLLRGVAASADPFRAVSLFKSMLSCCIVLDQFSFTFLLKARARCLSTAPTGRERGGGSDVHALALKCGCLAPVVAFLHVHNALIHVYACGGISEDATKLFDEMPEPDVVSWSGLLTAQLTAGDLEAARRIFDRMPVHDVVSWTAMISGYAQGGQPRRALALFKAMPSEVYPDEVTMVGVVSACAALGDLETGAAVHQYADEKGFGWMVSLRNALIDMYAKCGCMEKAREVFEATERKTQITWNTVISAYAVHGNDEAALQLFRRITTDDDNGLVKPDEATFLAALGACAHSGRVEEGRRILESMDRHGVAPTVEHYGCVVDMLGRAGRLEEAYQLMVGGQMRVPCNHVLWGALLGACRIHGNVEMAERAVTELLRRRPEEGGYYLLLAGIYAAAGRRAEADEIRRKMTEGRARKNPGHSSLCGGAGG
ncbi:hypothetical protein Taro_023236 [Colocasia esculenta]|uniref:Pentatricopeptide repeat-containing protein n=1 Tax=Colocasia esculenta TaxID=4460 RepID=A0A843UWU7_COLES|nr:hypothetical protein [Colocasia esculenta]